MRDLFFLILWCIMKVYFFGLRERVDRPLGTPSIFRHWLIVGLPIDNINKSLDNILVFTYTRNNVLIGEFVVCLRHARRYTPCYTPRPDFHQDTCDIRRELQYRVSGATEHILLLPVTFMEQYEKPCDTLPKRCSSLTNIENISTLFTDLLLCSSLI